MKKRVLIPLIALMLSAVLLCTACSSYGKIEKAFKDAGYTQSETLEGVTKSIEEQLEEQQLAVKLHVFNKDLVNTAVIIEFNSTDDMNKAVSESDALKGLVSDLYKAGEECDIVNGNCLLVPIGLNSKSMIDIFKNA